MKELELSSPIILRPTLDVVKNISEKIYNKAKDNHDSIESFYVLYILSAGLIDDLVDVLNSIDEEFAKLPI